MLSSGAIIDRVMKAQKKQIEMLQQQNKQLIEAIESVLKFPFLETNADIRCIKRDLQAALQQIKGDEES